MLTKEVINSISLHLLTYISNDVVFGVFMQRVHDPPLSWLFVAIVYRHRCHNHPLARLFPLPLPSPLRLAFSSYSLSRYGVDRQALNVIA